MATPRNNDGSVDCVEIASEDSFPASDPPAWGSSHAAPSESTVTADLDTPRHRLLKGLAIGIGSLGAVIAVVAAVRRVRSC